MGIQGHSFGGYETNYLVTRTGMFAAAASAAGPTDLVSISGEAELGVGSMQSFVESNQLRMRVPLWQNEAGYIRNSPVFALDKITTPLLIMHCKNDSRVPWQQALEMFIGLRRLGKSVYLLQYDNGGHDVDGSSAIDYTIKLAQFFDHYLKSAPAPKWMSEGIPTAEGNR